VSESGPEGGGVAPATPTAAASISVRGLTKRYGVAGVVFSARE
jgi:hypothetical protein